MNGRIISRLLFVLIVAFWVAMNWLLWRAEYESHGVGIRVPEALVWQKILTAPDISTLNIFQGGERTGFCEFSTSVEQEMAALDENDAVPKKINPHAGYQIRFNGNVSLGDFTNRLTFSGQIGFTPQREWREINLKLSSHATAIEIHSLAAEQTVRLVITGDGITNQQLFSFAELQNPNNLWSMLLGNLGEWTMGLNLPTDFQMPSVLAQNVHWEARLDRVMLGGESVLAYRLETRILDRPVVIYVSTLGEILRAELPGDVIALFDQLGNP